MNKIQMSVEEVVILVLMTMVGLFAIIGHNIPA